MAYTFMMGKKVNFWSDNWNPSNKNGKPHPICTTNSYALHNVSSLIDPHTKTWNLAPIQQLITDSKVAHIMAIFISAWSL